MQQVNSSAFGRWETGARAIKMLVCREGELSDVPSGSTIFFCF